MGGGNSRALHHLGVKTMELAERGVAEEAAEITQILKKIVRNIIRANRRRHHKISLSEVEGVGRPLGKGGRTILGAGRETLHPPTRRQKEVEEVVRGIRMRKSIPVMQVGEGEEEEEEAEKFRMLTQVTKRATIRHSIRVDRHPARLQEALANVRKMSTTITNDPLQNRLKTTAEMMAGKR